MPSLTTTADARLCPHCRQENHCAIALGQDAGQCWCHDTTFNPERVAEYQGLNRCLCEHCGTEFNTPDSRQKCVQNTSETRHCKDSHGQ